MQCAARLAGPVVGLLVFIIGFLAGWRFSTTLIASAAATFATLAVVTVARRQARKDEASE